MKQNSDVRTLLVVSGIILACIFASCLLIGGFALATSEPLRTIVLSNPKTAVEYNQKGLALHNLGRDEEAIPNYSMAIALNPNYAEAFLNRGNTYSRIEKYGLGIADYKKATELDPKQALAWGYLCWYGVSQDTRRKCSMLVTAVCN